MHDYMGDMVINVIRSGAWDADLDEIIKAILEREETDEFRKGEMARRRDMIRKVLA